MMVTVDSFESPNSELGLKERSFKPKAVISIHFTFCLQRILQAESTLCPASELVDLKSCLRILCFVR